ncbi:MAG: hypothetical protein HKO58_04035 [Gammaproteobacteria bacterium]|nr:hypothetical protein [Gammaproteobacteria bacterium]
MKTTQDIDKDSDKNIDDHTEETMSRLREHLNKEPSPPVQRRLQEMRHAAIDSLDKKSWFALPPLVPALGVSAALVLGVGITWNTLQQPGTPETYLAESTELEVDELIYLAENSLAEEDFQILLDSESEYPALEFLDWASEQPEFM